MAKIISAFTVLVLLIGAICWLRLSDERTVTATAYGVEKITKTHGNKDGFNTDVYYLLTTDQGTYQIRIDGPFAHPEYTQAIQPDSLYQITVIGKSIPFWGIYPQVKELHKLDKKNG